MKQCDEILDVYVVLLLLRKSLALCLTLPFLNEMIAVRVSNVSIFFEIPIRIKLICYVLISLKKKAN